MGSLRKSVTYRSLPKGVNSRVNGTAGIRGTLVLVVGLASCSSSNSDRCDPPVQDQAVYPYTGEWRAQGAEGVLCLYQTGPQSVYGFLGNVRAVGIVHPSGELSLALAPSAEAEVYAIRLLHDTLTVENGSSSSESPLRLHPRWLRSKPSVP
jgi:hypothetical protein